MAGVCAAEVEAALARLGHFRLHQRYVVALAAIPAVIAAAAVVVRTTPTPIYRCSIPECEEGEYIAPWAIYAMPPDDRCSRFAAAVGAAPCTPEYFHQNHINTCGKHVYLHNDTFFAEFQLACTNAEAAGEVLHVLSLLLLPLAGYACDKWGRRLCVCACGAASGLCGVLQSYATQYQFFLLGELLQPTLIAGYCVGAFLIALEVGVVSLRGVFSCAVCAAYGVGGALWAAVAKSAWLHDWRHRWRWAHMLALPLLLYTLLLDEGARWLLARGRTRAAVAQLTRAARWNLTPPPPTPPPSPPNPAQLPPPPPDPCAMLARHPRLRLRTSLCCAWWIAAASLHSGRMTGDRYTDVALDTGIEVVAALLVMMALGRGRNKCLCAAFAVCMIAAVVPLFLSESRVRSGMRLAGRLSAECAAVAAAVFTAELFPTRCRATALCQCAVAANLTRVLAPYVTPVDSRWEAIVAAVVALAGASLALLPEDTKRSPLPNTPADMHKSAHTT